jgi:hypothetical protein
MANERKITSETIAMICEKFGFPYEFREGRHLATVDGEEMEVKFKPDGALPPGRHRFMTKARESNEKFLTAYLPSARRSNGSSRSTDGDSTKRLTLGRQLLRRYSIAELEKTMELIGGIVDEKKGAAKVAKEIEEREGELANLEELSKGIEKSGFTPHEQITTRIAEIETELGELQGK